MINMIDANEEDTAFLYELYRSTRLREVSSWGWGEQEMEVFLRMQFDLQQRSYALQFPQASHLILMNNQLQAGRVIVHETPAEIRLVDISILPEFGNQGIGTAVLVHLQNMARTDSKSIRLHVIRSNPAITFYERIGFRIRGGDDVYVHMEWSASTERTGGNI
ncbi:GNAT family N-acetyltransferase [Paenibacillus sp. Dod16]|uniref:GNAT family N-acetyltransferase n=1 Tax=Paenibacillus sp. Dod16 TaxID=3416392 RepID=UPI003CF4B798